MWQLHLQPNGRKGFFKPGTSRSYEERQILIHFIKIKNFCSKTTPLRDERQKIHAMYPTDQ